MGNSLSNRINQYVTVEDLEDDFNQLQSRNEELMKHIHSLQNQLTTKDNLLSQMESRFQEQITIKDEIILKRHKEHTQSNNDLRNEMNVMKNIIAQKDKHIEKYTDTIKRLISMHSQIQEVLRARLL